MITQINLLKITLYRKIVPAHPGFLLSLPYFPTRAPSLQLGICTPPPSPLALDTGSCLSPQHSRGSGHGGRSITLHNPPSMSPFHRPGGPQGPRCISPLPSAWICISRDRTQAYESLWKIPFSLPWPLWILSGDKPVQNHSLSPSFFILHPSFLSFSRRKLYYHTPMRRGTALPSALGGGEGSHSGPPWAVKRLQ